MPQLRALCAIVLVFLCIPNFSLASAPQSFITIFEQKRSTFVQFKTVFDLDEPIGPHIFSQLYQTFPQLEMLNFSASLGTFLYDFGDIPDSINLAPHGVVTVMSTRTLPPPDLVQSISTQLNAIFPGSFHLQADVRYIPVINNTIMYLNPLETPCNSMHSSFISLLPCQNDASWGAFTVSNKSDMLHLFTADYVSYQFRSTKNTADLELILIYSSQNPPEFIYQNAVQCPLESPIIHKRISKFKQKSPVEIRGHIYHNGLDTGTLYYSLTPETDTQGTFVLSLPNFIRPWFYTLTFNGRKFKPNEIEVEKLYHGSTVALRIPNIYLQANSKSEFKLDFDKKFMHYNTHPADPHRGRPIPSALFISDSRISFSNSQLLMLALPDFSMPFNVIALSFATLAFVFSQLFNATTDVKFFS